jgi:hypothetical protein
MARTGSHDNFHFRLSEISTSSWFIFILLGGLMENTCLVIPLFAEERIEQEVLMKVVGMKADLVLRAALTRRLG